MATESPLPSLPSSIFNIKLYRNILSVWFDGLPQDAPAPDYEHVQRWFGVGDEMSRNAFDQSCRDVASEALEALGPSSFPLPVFVDYETDRINAELLSRPMRETLYQAQGAGMDLLDAAFALVLLLDQLPRNCLRSFEEQNLVYNHYDRLSRFLIYYILDDTYAANPLHCIDRHERIQKLPAWRCWFYMALMHSEDLADHNEFQAKVLEMQDTVAASGRKDAVDYAQRALNSGKQHRTLIEQFGRYPHRNDCLGRVVTAEERKYLEDGGETFGTRTSKG